MDGQVTPAPSFPSILHTSKTYFWYIFWCSLGGLDNPPTSLGSIVSKKHEYFFCWVGLLPHWTVVVVLNVSKAHETYILFLLGGEWLLLAPLVWGTQIFTNFSRYQLPKKNPVPTYILLYTTTDYSDVVVAVVPILTGYVLCHFTAWSPIDNTLSA